MARTTLSAQTTIAPLDGGGDLLGVASRLPDAALVTVAGWQVLVADPLEVVTDLAGLDEAAAALGWRGPPGRAGAPPFRGAAVGYLGDDLSPALLNLPRQPWDARPPVAPLPALRFGVHDSAVCRGPDGTTLLVAADVPGFTVEPAAARLARWRGRFAAAPAAPTARGARAGAAATLREHATGARAHARAVGKVLDLIAAGTLYQLNLTLQVAAEWPYGGAALFRLLAQVNPGAPHAAFLRCPSADGPVEIVSVSPETFLRTAGSRVVSRPIKGTRPRGRDRHEDLARRRALERSAKDAAEHVMIVDLVRSDLGRVCEVGSVRVPVLAATEAHPTVWHLTSDVAGELRPDVTISDLVRATFPCGSVTGAPKREAVRHAAALEPLRRGVYCGAIGMLSRTLDLSVAIRTALVHGGIASYGTGGGIVADSDPHEEWLEAMAKAAAFLRVLASQRSRSGGAPRKGARGARRAGS